MIISLIKPFEYKYEISKENKFYILCHAEPLLGSVHEKATLQEPLLR
jgi:hypothetical protein